MGVNKNSTQILLVTLMCLSIYLIFVVSFFWFLRDSLGPSDWNAVQKKNNKKIHVKKIRWFTPKIFGKTKGVDSRTSCLKISFALLLTSLKTVL